MPDDLRDPYKDDILLWSRQQADLLRRLRQGERVKEQVDWDHVIEEIVDVGNNAIDVIEGCLATALQHLLKIAAWPGSRDVNRWIVEARAALTRARRRARREGTTLRREVEGDLPELYRDALQLIRDEGEMDGVAPLRLRGDLPLTLNALLDEHLDPRATAALLRAAD